MPLFQAVRRYKQWPVRVPLWDARECPDCAALVTGDKGQDAHRAYHETMREWQDQVFTAIEQVAAGAGLTTTASTWDGGEAHGLDERDDELHDAKRRRVRWSTLVTRTDDDDEQLTRRTMGPMNGEEDGYGTADDE